MRRKAWGAVLVLTPLVAIFCISTAVATSFNHNPLWIMLAYILSVSYFCLVAGLLFFIHRYEFTARNKSGHTENRLY